MPFTAKYATTCGQCRQPIRPGEQIVSLAGGSTARWAHASCAGSVPAGAAASDEVPRPPQTGTLLDPGDSAPAPVEVYTDGACSGNPGPGGWAWATRDGRQASGGEARTTNQRMEVTAALEAVRTLDDSPLVVVSDSSYVVNCFRDRWWQGWLDRGWLTSARKPVANRDLWEPLVELVRRRGDVRFRWVRGHSGDPMNDLVDRLAVAAGEAARAPG